MGQLLDLVRTLKLDTPQAWVPDLGPVQPAMLPTPPPTSFAVALEADPSPATEEGAFRQWYGTWAQRFNMNPDPDAPEQHYDYRSAFKAGVQPPNVERGEHWPSTFMTAGHENLVVGGFHTQTGERVPGTPRAASVEELIQLGWDPETAPQLMALPEPPPKLKPEPELSLDLATRLPRFAQALQEYEAPPMAVSHRSTQEPPLAVSHEPPPNVYAAAQKATSIGPARIGDRYVPTEGNWSLLDVLRTAAGMGSARPTSVAAQDPYGIQAWERGTGETPGFAGITLAPRRDALELLEKFASGEKATPEIRAAVKHLIERYPRLMSHVEDVAPTQLATIEKPGVMGRMIPEFPTWYPQAAREKTRPIASIHYDPSTLPKGEELNVLAHELTHVAQAVKQTDIASRVAGEPTFSRLYDRMNQAQGYYNNPLEVSARQTAQSVETKKLRVFDPRNVARKVFESTGDVDAVAQRLRQLFPTNTEKELTTALRYGVKDPSASLPPRFPQMSRRVWPNETPELATQGYRKAQELLHTYQGDLARTIAAARTVTEKLGATPQWDAAIRRLELMAQPAAR